jgi:oligoendopeptidase F
MKKNLHLFPILVVLVVSLLAAKVSFSQVMVRSEIPEKYRWNLTNIYPSDEAWRAAKDALALRIGEIDAFRGTLTRSAQDLLACMELNSAMSKEATRLYIYASLNSDLDTRNMYYSGMTQELAQMFSEFGARSAFIQPEILTADWSLIEGFINEKPGLEPYRKGLDNLFRLEKHNLSEPEERIMALSGTIGGVAGSIYTTFFNAEMPSGEAVLPDGSTKEISFADYARMRASASREERDIVFDVFFNNLKRFKASFGEMLYGSIKSDIFRARARNYGSTLEASLFPNHIPVEVYHALIDNVNENLPTLHRYLEIKKRMLDVDTLKYSDLYAPTVKDVTVEYPYDQATETILQAFAPMGEDYVSVVYRAISERWIDVYPSPGKRSRAYSNGAFYDGNPFILLNYTGLYSDMTTLAHELGHTMHSYLSNKNQPFPLSRYETFVAEVASTFNEVLLFEHMIRNETDDEVKLSILMNWLEMIRQTLFRQTQFAAFELQMHQAAEKGIPLTGDKISQMYLEFVRAYHGHDEGICYVDDYIEMEWAFVHHFYRRFYVYQYSTSLTASVTLAEKVLGGEPGAMESYMEFLSSGGSDYPVELLRKAGVDMTTSEPFDKTMASMNKVMDEIERILDSKN